MKKLKKISIITAVLLVVIGGTVWVVMALPAKAPDTDSADSKAIVGYIASKDFANLTDKEKADYLAKLRGLPDDKRSEIFRAEDLDDKTRAAMRENMFAVRRAQQHEKMVNYFALSPEDKLAALDKDIDDQEARRAEWQQNGAGQGRPGGPGGPGGFNRDPDVREKFMEGMLEATTPEDRAYQHEYRIEIQARRKALGK